jgi:hypothetical protein
MYFSTREAEHDDISSAACLEEKEGQEVKKTITLKSMLFNFW